MRANVRGELKLVFSFVDAGGLLLAVLLAGVLIALPALAIARLLGLSRSGGAGDPLTGLTSALAVLPVVTSLATKLLGLDAALGLDLAIAAAGLAVLARDRMMRPTWSVVGAVVLAGWLALLVVEWIDLDIGGRLYQPLTIIDTVKHAATTQAILDSGVPPRDAFFLRPERSSYYYYFYTLSALVARASFGLVDAKAAVGGLVFWVGVGLYGLVRLALDRAGIVLACVGSRRTLVILAVLAAGGLDIVVDLLLTARSGGIWIPDPFWWNEQVSMWSDSVIWTPHHVTALIASVVGLVALCDLAATHELGMRLRRGSLAALAFASTIGLSVWVALALAASTGVWGLVLVARRRWRTLGLVVGAGLVAILLAMPAILDMHAGRGGPLPLAFQMRAFPLFDALTPSGPWRSLVRLVALPINYLLAFGAVAIGAVLFWWRREPVSAATDFPLVLAIAAGTALVIGTGVRSVLHNNDLGWRVMLFPLLAGAVWTIAVVDRALAARPAGLPLWRALPPRLALGLAIGWATSASTFISMRIYPWLRVIPEAAFIASDPQTDRALRTAYAWANANLPTSAVLQHNPTQTRAFAFGVYSRNPIAVSDNYGDIYGTSHDAVTARIEALAPIYWQAVPAAKVKSIAERDGIDDLVVTADDPVWRERRSFVWTSTPVYASDRVRIIPVTRLGG